MNNNKEMMTNKEGGPTSFILSVETLVIASASGLIGQICHWNGDSSEAKQKELGSVAVSRQFIPRRGHSLMVKFQPSKLAMRVRFPLPAFRILHLERKKSY
jgi:hypothetical protein